MGCADDYKWLNGYRSRLMRSVSATERSLPVADEMALAARLVDGYTFVAIDDGTGAEIVKVEPFGNELKIMRGQEGTEAKAFPAGACVMWLPTQQALMAGCGSRCCGRQPDGASANVPQGGASTNGNTAAA